MNQDKEKQDYLDLRTRHLKRCLVKLKQQRKPLRRDLPVRFLRLPDPRYKIRPYHNIAYLRAARFVMTYEITLVFKRGFYFRPINWWRARGIYQVNRWGPQ